jgi:hypothetical protein
MATVAALTALQVALDESELVDAALLKEALCRHVPAELLPGCKLVTDLNMEDHSPAALKVCLAATPEAAHTPLLGLEVVASNLGYLFRDGVDSQQPELIMENEIAAPPLPAFAGGVIHSALPLTVCYGVDQVQRLTSETEGEQPACFCCHASHAPLASEGLGGAAPAEGEQPGQDSERAKWLARWEQSLARGLTRNGESAGALPSSLLASAEGADALAASAAVEASSSSAAASDTKDSPFRWCWA